MKEKQQQYERRREFLRTRWEDFEKAYRNSGSSHMKKLAERTLEELKEFEAAIQAAERRTDAVVMEGVVAAGEVAA